MKRLQDVVTCTLVLLCSISRIPGTDGTTCDQPELNIMNFMGKAAPCMQGGGGPGAPTAPIDELLSPSSDESPYCCAFHAQARFGQIIGRQPNKVKGIFTDLCNLQCSIKRCVEGRSECNDDWNAWFLKNAPVSNILQGSVCSGCDLKPEYKKLEDDPEVDPQCLETDVEYAMDIVTCMRPDYMNKLTPMLQNPSVEGFTELLRFLVRLLRQVTGCVRDTPSTTCSNNSKEYVARYAEVATSFTITYSKSVVDLSPVWTTKPVNLASEARCSVGVTGDPHMFRDGCGSGDSSDNFVRETCSATGKQLYLGNKYIQVQGTDTLLADQGEGGATTMTEIKILFSWEGAKIGSLSASEGAVPTTLSKVGETDKLEVVSTDASSIVIRYRPVGMWIEVKAWKHNYFFTIRMSKDLYEASYGLLKGCPSTEAIDISSVLANQRRRRQAPAQCDKVTDGLMEACRYDCAVMGGDECGAMTQGSSLSLTAAPQDDDVLVASAGSGQQPGTTVSGQPGSTVYKLHTTVGAEQATTTPTSTATSKSGIFAASVLTMLLHAVKLLL